MSIPPDDSQLPSLDLLRQITDSHVLDRLLASEALTRAEMAAATGISKPTISESVRRLVSSGLLAESGRQVGKRGRAGTFYQLRHDAGVAMALSVGPDGMIIETCDLRGTLLKRVEQAVPKPASSAVLSPIMVELVTTAVHAAPGPVRGWALSVAGPVDQHTGQLIPLPNSPFLVDELNPRELVGHLAATPLQVDNDVNWAALAEHHEGSAQDLTHFFYCYLGEGIGGALVSGGQIFHGTRGLAGELAQVRTDGPGGRSRRLVQCFGSWELLQPGTQAIDIGRLTEILKGQTADQRRLRDAVAGAVAGALCSVTALFNPRGIVIGGPWSDVGGFAGAVAERVHSQAAVDAEVRSAALDNTAPLTGARIQAVLTARRSLLGRD